MIELWIIISTVCFNVVNNSLMEKYLNRGLGVGSYTLWENKCFEQVSISTFCPSQKEGQTVKRICDYTGHKWTNRLYNKEGYIYQPFLDENIEICIFCGKKRKRVVNETIEYIDIE